jgi:multidrug resistance efflux pump
MMNELQEAFEREIDLAERLSSAEAKVEEMEEFVDSVKIALRRYEALKQEGERWVK